MAWYVVIKGAFIFFCRIISVECLTNFNLKLCTLDSLINVPGTFINFWKFFQGVCSYLRGYVYWIWRFLDTKLEFSPKNPLYYNILLILSMGIRLYQGVRLLILKKTPGGTIIPGGTFIRESRVLCVALLY